MFQPEIWKNYHAIELFPHHFSQFLMSEIGFSRTEVIGSPVHHARGFQRPIKLFIKEDPSFDTPIYSANTSVRDSATPRYCRDTPGHLDNFGNAGSYSFRLPDECSGDSNFAYGTPNSLTSSESGFSEGLHPRRYIPPMRYEHDAAQSSSQSQRDCLGEAASSSEESSTIKYELLEDEDNTLDSTNPGCAVEDNETDVVKNEITDVVNPVIEFKQEKNDKDGEKNEITDVVNPVIEFEQERIAEDSRNNEIKDAVDNITEIKQQTTVVDKVAEDVSGENETITVVESAINVENPEKTEENEEQLVMIKNEMELAKSV